MAASWTRSETKSRSPLLQVSGLKYGNKYNYRVFAENAAGVSDPSNLIGPLLADDPHGEIGDTLNQSHHQGLFNILVEAM